MTVTPNRRDGAPYTELVSAPRYRRPKYGQWVAGVLITLFLAFMVKSFAGAKIEWDMVGDYLFDDAILKGVRTTILLTFLTMVLSLVLGTVIAIMGLSHNLVTSASAKFYVWLFRGTPTLLQLLLWFNIALIFPVISIPGIWSDDTINVMTPFLAAFLGLGISDSAYTSEVIRAGIKSIDQGQTEAALAMGMSKRQLMRRIIMPQAMRVIVPPIGNSVIGMLKYTSLAAIISYNELLRQAQIIYFVNNRVVELLMVCAFWYLVCVSVLTVIQHYIERYFGRGFGAAAHVEPMPDDPK
ncbi:ABC transporter permease [Acrocarpospora pleiomorpha]|uniref:ABC transporter permease n=1 Tax=Acrocarpospora pleiomorpha TaxID=90975 RepID=A0A5M3XDU6_9ACTN|nr:amino acid ABC transporter permease [Acrocarpospora pleiomorpha]GES19434.1 ABC transporter permease [Acrocarpospora pleiomorpha]